MSNPTYGTAGFGNDGYGNQSITNLPIGYYLDLLTSEYKKSPKLNKFLLKMLRKFDEVDECLVLFDTVLSIDSAAGPQLDQLGSIVGAGRVVGFQPTGGGSPTLDDDDYRLYIKAKVARNLWDGTLDGLQSVWAILFPDFKLAVLDNQNMTMTVFIVGTISSTFSDLVQNGYIVPRPEGVLCKYVLGPYPLFGFGQVQGFIDGFDIGHWS
jgi:hypothetical protein